MKGDDYTIPKGLRELDDIVAEVAGGVYVLPSCYPNANLSGLIEYCKREKRPYEELTNEELKMFGLDESQRKDSQIPYNKDNL